jgi:hypothetical protein
VQDPVEVYFTQVRDIYNSGAGVAETTYYPALCGLLSAIGSRLKPKVTAITHLRNTGAGIPDGGLYTADQLRGGDGGGEPLGGQHPRRGAIEVKGTAEDAAVVAQSDQVARYVEHYGLVLVTNLRDFVLVGRDAAGGGARQLESWSLAATESVFWARVQQPRKFAEDQSEGLTEFLRRVLLHSAPLADPKDLAWFLASYARTARVRLEQRHGLPVLDQLRGQLEDALGLKFEGERGDHFFRSTLVQTLFYGMFASWVLWARDMDHAEAIPWERRFEWETASRTLHVPMVAELFYQFSNPGRLRDLEISEILEWAEEVLWRVDRAAFFKHFREDHAVQYFYEPFLEAFDPQLRKDLGVWYTPDEVVRYMVSRVDTALRDELGISDGLADPSVIVLDPCCGTGAYLVEVLRKIDETLQAKGADALTSSDVKRAAMNRVIGFEIMPAPFVIAHLQMGILLASLQVPLEDADERAAIYLTNSLTGWAGGQTSPPRDRRVGEGQMHSTLLFPEFAEERDAANRVKREERVLVVIGNPPYNGFAGVAQEEEAELIEPYKRGLSSDWGITKNSLDDLYVRFIRLAERTIAASDRGGVVCYISNFSWLGDPSAVVMRASVLGSFDRVLIDNLNGDSRETGKRTPEGLTDPSVFSGPSNSQGIQVGTAIALMVSTADKRPTVVGYRDFWGAGKRHALAAIAAGESAGPEYLPLAPSRDNRFVLRPFRSAPAYSAWPSVVELSGAQASLGLNENRGGALVDSDATALADRMRTYFDSSLHISQLPESLDGLKKAWARFDAAATREALLRSGGFDEKRVMPFLSKPFDSEWAYAEPRSKLWNEARASLVRSTGRGTRFLIARARSPRAMDGAPFDVFTGLVDQHALHKDAYLIPMTIGGAADSLLAESEAAPNLASKTAEYLTGLGLAPNADASEALWLHVLGIGYSPAYQRENDDAVRAGWPRVPLPSSAAALEASSSLGRRVAELLDVSPWAIRPDLECVPKLGRLSSVSGHLDPARDLAVTSRWGVAGRDGITMPSSGRVVEREYAADELAEIAAAAPRDGLTAGEALTALGDTCFDVFINDVAYWRCVPSSVWRYTVGGFQVIKKWLSYRETALTGRDLTSEEARYITEMVRRITALVLVQPLLDRNYERAKSDAWGWR